MLKVGDKVKVLKGCREGKVGVITRIDESFNREYATLDAELSLGHNIDNLELVKEDTMKVIYKRPMTEEEQKNAISAVFDKYYIARKGPETYYHLDYVNKVMQIAKNDSKEIDEIIINNSGIDIIKFKSGNLGNQKYFTIETIEPGKPVLDADVMRDIVKALDMIKD